MKPDLLTSSKSNGALHPVVTVKQKQSREPTRRHSFHIALQIAKQNSNYHREALGRCLWHVCFRWDFSRHTKNLKKSTAAIESSTPLFLPGVCAFNSVRVSVTIGIPCAKLADTGCSHADLALACFQTSRVFRWNANSVRVSENFWSGCQWPPKHSK